MRKIILSLVAAAAVATPFAATAGPASAATNGTGTGSMHFVTNATYIHDSVVQYTCDGKGNVNFEYQGAEEGFTGHGQGTIAGSVFEVTGSRNTDSYTYTIAGTVGDDGAWSDVTATDSVNPVGSLSVTGAFKDVPDCTVDPVVPAGNHGQWVSGAVKAGFKGKALAAIAQDVSKVGPYTGPLGS